MAKAKPRQTKERAGFTSANVKANFWKPENPGDEIEGHYQGSRLMPKRGQYAEQTVFDIADDSGELIIVSGASLPRQFDRVPEGAKVIVIYHGRIPMDKGKAPMKNFEVLVEGELLPLKKND